MNESEIIHMYTVENKTPTEIAEQFNTYPNKIRRFLTKRGYELKSRSESQKIALASGRKQHPTAGKKRTEEEKFKISKTASEKWNKLDNKEKTRRSLISKNRWNNLSSIKKEEMRQSSVEAIRLAGKNGSKIEQFVAKEIGKLYKLEFHKKDLIVNANLEIDIYLPELKTIIEIDGPSHFLPIWGEEKLNKQIKADLDKNGLILSKGFNIIRIKVLKRTSIARRKELVQDIIRTLNNIEQQIITNCITEIEV